MTKPRDDKFSCACGSALAYNACCGRWHSGPTRLQAPDARSLMRSRYTAYVLDDLEYLLDTWHVRTRPPVLEPKPPGWKWLGLEIKRFDVEGDAHARVEFVARSRLHGKASRLHETSRFVRENGIWLYVDGVIRE